MKVFFDTNVLLDVLLQRSPFAMASARAWALVETGQIEGFVSAVSFTNIYYIARRLHSRALALESLRIIRSLFAPVPCDAAVLGRAIDRGGDDFEDDVQYFSAASISADVLLTRDQKGFPRGSVVVLTPASFLATHGLE